jgi:transposase
MATALGTMTAREIRAVEMLRDGHRVAETSAPGRYIVASQSGAGLYQVEGVGIPGLFESCTCPDFLERLAPCKHIFLVRNWIRTQSNPISTAGSPLRPAPHAKAPINWRAYDAAQQEEYRLFHTLLRDLCLGFPEPFRDPHMAGQKAIPLRDQAFCAVQKLYLGFPCRTSQGFREEAARKGQLNDAHYWAISSRFLCRDDVTEGLHDMLARSAIPLMGIEDRCAIDSTGLRTTRFNYYRKEKYEPSRENIWRKLHALTGVKTHVIPVLEVTEGSANDSPLFPILLKRASANGFRFREVYADKAYNSRTNFNAAAELHVEPFIPPKRNQTGEAKGSPMYHKMFLFFQYRREEYDIHYGQRAQVESAFGSFKQKLGETLASRKFCAQENEILAKAVAFNVMILVRQMFETGILPEFLRPPRARGPQLGVRSPDDVTPRLAIDHVAIPAPVAESPTW